MKKVAITLFSLLCASILFAQENRILLLNSRGLNIYNLEENFFIVPLEEPETWSIYSATKENGVINIILNKRNDSSETWVKSFLIDENSYSLLSVNSFFFRSSNYISLESKITEILGPMTSKKKVISSWNGNIYLLDNKNENDNIGDYLDDNNQSPFISSFLRGKILCGYYGPVLSKDEKFIVCVYEQSKHDRKKNIGKHEIVEINVQSKEVTYLSLYGDNPSYSADASMILYNDVYNGRYKNARNKWNIYFKSNGEIKSIPNAFDVAWVK